MALEPEKSKWLSRVRDNLEEHVFFWITLLIALLIFFGVPQVTNIWQQRPPFEEGFLTTGGYLLFLSFLVGFYGLSMFVVIRRFPAQSVQDRVEAFVKRQMTHWHEGDLSRLDKLFHWFSLFTWRAPDLCSRWVVAAVKVPAGQSLVPRSAIVLLLVALVGASALVFGARSHTGRAYPLAGACCQLFAVLGLATAIWLLAVILARNCLARQAPRDGERPVHHTDAAPDAAKPAEEIRAPARVFLDWYINVAAGPGEVWLYFGRLLAWLISTALVGELLWVIAGSNLWDNLVSYRLYTIWSVAQLLTTLVIVGLLIDRWHDASVQWPIRQIALLLLPGVVWLFSRPMAVPLAELDLHLSADQAPVWKALRADAAGAHNAAAWHARANGKWFAHLNNRMKEIPDDQPVVLVAASGGGSRAAIFTALVLETLARTPTASNAAGRTIPLATEPTGDFRPAWADNILLISSVSGGSLATAYHLTHRIPRALPPLVPESSIRHTRALRNTNLVELQHWGLGYAADLIQAYLEDAPPEFTRELVPDYYTKDPAARSAGVAVASLKKSEKALRERLQADVKERDSKQNALTATDAAPPNAAELAQDVDRLSERISANRTALALLDAYRFLDVHAADRSGTFLGDWLWTSLAFDEMCVDFMAPLMRGLLTPQLDRGDALARFWTDRFHWTNCTNFSGYHGGLAGWNYGPERPAVVFNAVDVARGSRLAIGFPPLPSDLWDAVYQRGVTRESPRALNAPVSLARAVRMSSNFPFGFRAMEFRVPSRSPGAAQPAQNAGRPTTERVHVIDGGAVDNTGLDTIYELFLAMEFHADLRNQSPYQGDAAKLLADLRRHGVCVLEIDAGAKPNTDLPARLNPIGGLLEQSQALENGGYSNADRAKQLYLREIRRILTQRLDETTSAACECQDSLPTTCLHYCFQCNHYQPGKGADPTIMTAWALGPRDKAEVVARFLPELSLWDQRREQLWRDIATSKKTMATARNIARLRNLLDQVAAAARRFAKLSGELGDVEMLAPGKQRADRLAVLRRKLSDAKQQLTPLAASVGRETDKDLRTAWNELQRQVNADFDRLANLERAAIPNVGKVEAAPASPPESPREARDSYGRIGASLQAADDSVKKASADVQQKARIDPQYKYDQANRQLREVYEKKPAEKR